MPDYAICVSTMNRHMGIASGLSVISKENSYTTRSVRVQTIVHYIYRILDPSKILAAVSPRQHQRPNILVLMIK